MSLLIKTDKAQSLAETGSCQTTDGNKLFRNFFAHLSIKPDGCIFELGETEVWEQDCTLARNLDEVLRKELATIAELTEFEDGLQFALLRMLELVRTRYNLFVNPYYNDAVQLDVEPYGEWE